MKKTDFTRKHDIVPEPKLLQDCLGTQSDGWIYQGHPNKDEDARKIVTLEKDGMQWVGIRAWNHNGGYWMNGNEPETATVKAWRNLPQPAKGFWYDGEIHIPVETT